MADLTSSTPEDAGYEETAGYEWTEKAHAMLERGELRAKVFETDDVRSVHVWGQCPRCGHKIDDRQPLSAAVMGPGRDMRDLWATLTTFVTGGATRGDIHPAAAITVDVDCGCSRTHIGAPDKTTGCGVSFRLGLPVPPRTP